MRCWQLRLTGLIAASLLGCTGVVGETTRSGEFSIDPYPQMVNRTPATITGSRPSGSAVHVDGAERFAAEAGTAWTLDLDLAQGPNRFLIGPVDATGEPGPTTAVDLILDDTAPTVVSKTPAPGATGVAGTATVDAVFDEPIDCSSVTSGVFSIRNVGSTLSCSTAGAATTARLTPNTALAPSTTFTALLLGAGTVRDLAGNTLAADVTWQFTTGSGVDTVPPAPPTFDSPAPPAAPIGALLVQVGGSHEADASVEHRWSIGGSPQNSWTEIAAKTPATTWQYDFPLALGVNLIELRSVDLSGNISPVVSFTVTVVDQLPPTVVTRVPAPGATGVVVNTSVDAVFSEVIDCATITAATFTLSGVTASPSCSSTATATTARLAPAAALAFGTSFTARVVGGASGAKDLAGNPLAVDATWSFTTGSFTDTTPPVPPTFDNPAPPASPTVNPQATVGGAKEADASVELRWSVNSVVQTNWTEIAAKTSATTWQSPFTLNLGTNLIELRSVDLAGNVSTVVSFTVSRVAAVNPPTLNPVVTPTTVGNQVLSGGKPANTSVWNGPTQLVPIDGATTWTSLVQLTSGANAFDLVAKDAASASSAAAPRQTIQYTPAGALTAGQLKIEFELRDMWNFIGDEFRVCNSCSPGGNSFNHYGVDVWIEGPITQRGPGQYEACVFDAARQQRRHSRYVATVSHSRGAGCSNPATNPDCNGWWGETNYRSPNYLAALIESGRWGINPPTLFPFASSVVRRDPATGEQWPFGITSSSPCTVQYPQLFFPCSPTNGCPWGCWSKPKMLQRPVIDGLTEASTNASFSNSTRLAANGAALGSWKQAKTYRWNLRDLGGAFVQRGPYLVNVALTLDRALPAMPHWSSVLATDRETCWDNAAHDARGVHRVEGIIEIDGATATTVYWREKGEAETVNACAQAASGNPLDGVKCSCAGSTFPCPALPNTQAGSPVLYLTPNKFTDPGNSQTYPMTVQYCPTGPCP